MVFKAMQLYEITWGVMKEKKRSGLVHSQVGHGWGTMTWLIRRGGCSTGGNGGLVNQRKCLEKGVKSCYRLLLIEQVKWKLRIHRCIWQNAACFWPWQELFQWSDRDKSLIELGSGQSGKREHEVTRIDNLLAQIILARNLQYTGEQRKKWGDSSMRIWSERSSFSEALFI